VIIKSPWSISPFKQESVLPSSLNTYILMPGAILAAIVSASV